MDISQLFVPAKSYFVRQDLVILAVVAFLASKSCIIKSTQHKVQRIAGILRHFKDFSDFELFLLPGRVHVPPTGQGHL
jgi:hypothetical protein